MKRSTHLPLFDLDLLRALAVVAECGSFTVAASQLHSTQSTISQKIRRLEDMAGRKLLDRSMRGVYPTDAGLIVLGYARQLLDLNDQLHQTLSGAAITVVIRLGVPEDFSSGKTMRRLAAFNRRHPHVKLEVSSGLSSDLSARYDQGELDLILIKQRHHAREAIARMPEKTAWVDSVKHPVFHLDPIPLVAFPQPGVYRNEIINAVESLGRKWRMAFTSSSLSGIQAAVADGMGISLLPLRAVTSDHVVFGKAEGLPSVDLFELAVCHRPTADPMIQALGAELIDMLSAE